MDEQDKKDYLEGYRQAKKKGVPFFPDIVFKDAVAALVVFLILVALAFFLGAPLEEPADPADANYSPKPEWYFLFLFQLLWRRTAGTNAASREPGTATTGLASSSWRQ